MKGIARHHGKPRRVQEADLMVVSSACAIERNDCVPLIKPRKIGTDLLLAAFVMVQVLVLFMVAFLLIAYYWSLWDKVKDDQHNAHSMYRSVVSLSIGFTILRVGVFVIAFLQGSQFALSNPRAALAFGLSMLFTFLAPVAESAVACIIICKGKPRTDDDGGEGGGQVAGGGGGGVGGAGGGGRKENAVRFCKNFQHLTALLAVFAFLQNIVAAIIPISVLLVMFPGQVLSTVALISSSIVCTAIFTAHIFHLDSPRRFEKNSTRCMSRAKIVSQAIALMLFIGMLSIVFVFYLLLLSRGLNDAGLVGFVVSLIPSFIFSYTAKRIADRLLKE